MLRGCPDVGRSKGGGDRAVGSQANKFDTSIKSFTTYFSEQLPLWVRKYFSRILQWLKYVKGLVRSSSVYILHILGVMAVTFRTDG